MKDYLKMSDYFVGEIEPDDVVILDGCLPVIVFASSEEAAAHAINSHDELVDMNNELLKTLKNALEECEFEIRHGGRVCVDTYAIRKAIEMAEGGAA
ncbi:MAG: hypothetical protein ACRDBQ_21535 [Shewanella sp.]